MKYVLRQGSASSHGAVFIYHKGSRLDALFTRGGNCIMLAGIYLFIKKLLMDILNSYKIFNSSFFN